MNKNRKLRVVTYTLAAGMLIGAAGLNLSAAPLAGATAALSNNNVTTQAEATTPTHTAVAGVNLVMSANISEEAASSVSESATEAVATNAPADYTGIAIAQVNDYVNVRSVASEDGDVVGKLYNNSAAQVLATEGDWYQITSGNCTGYVKSEFVVVDNPELAAAVSRRVATVNTETLYVRSEPSTEASVITMVPLSDDLTVVDESTLSDGWVKVNAEGGDGFVSADYIVLSTEFTYAESKEEEAARLAKEEAERKKAAAAAAAKKKQSSQSSSGGAAAPAPAGGGAGASVASYACQFVGNPYVYGGSSLTSGTDCSGFVMSVYGAFGVGLPHSSSADRSVGYAVSPDAMQPGDIVCYSGHVGIYVGNGTIVHASNPRTGITYSNAYYRNILAVRRIF